VALAIDASTPAKATGATTAITTASFSPPAGSMLLALVGRNWPNPAGGNSADGTVTGTGGLTWTLAGRKSLNTGSLGGAGTDTAVEIWRAFAVSAPGSITVTDTRGTVAGVSGDPGNEHMLKVMVITGAETAWGGDIDAASSTSGLPSVTNVTTRANSWCFAVASDWAQAGPGTVGSGQTMIDEYDVAGQVTIHSWRQTSTTPSSGTSVTSNLTAPLEQYNLLAIEIREPAASTVAFPPSRQTRRVLPLGVLARERARVSTPVRAQVNPPFPVNGIKQPRRLRGLNPRRGEAWLPVQPQVVVTAPTFPPLAVRERLKGLKLFRPRVAGPSLTPSADYAAVASARPRRLPRLSRRGAVASPVPVQVAPVAPSYPPQSWRAKVRGLRLFRPRTAGAVPAQSAGSPATTTRVRPQLRVRGHVAGPPVPQAAVTPPAYPPSGLRARLRGLRQTRPRVASPVPAQTVLIAPAYPPQAVRTRPRGLRLPRGKAAAPLPAQTVVVPPGYPPQAVRTRLRGVRLFRGRTSLPLPAHAQPPAARTPRAHPRTPWSRRGKTAAPVPGQVAVAPPAYPVRPVRLLLKGLRLGRGRSAMPVPPQIIVVAPKIVPVLTRLKLRALRLFRGHVATPLTAVCVCETHRPNLGTTARPGAGMTGRPGYGTTLRPASGMTFRPDTGTTSPPCTCSGGG
jgi:hypothetical protein